MKSPRTRIMPGNVNEGDDEGNDEGDDDDADDDEKKRLIGVT